MIHVAEDVSEHHATRLRHLGRDDRDYVLPDDGEHYRQVHFLRQQLGQRLSDRGIIGGKVNPPHEHRTLGELEHARVAVQEQVNQLLQCLCRAPGAQIVGRGPADDLLVHRKAFYKS